MSKTQKILSFFLIFSIITAGFFFPLTAKEVKADMASDFIDKCVTDAVFSLAESIGLGSVLSAIEDFLTPTKVPSNDSKSQIETRKFELKECLRRLKDLAIVTARNILKKRLLDQLVDQTVEWIQNGGEPRFVTDFQGFLEDAKQAAIGDTLRDIGLGKLCDSRSFAKIELSLGRRTPKQLTQDVSCTLDQVVGNIKAFREDFKNGGWLGIQEAANPRNNIFGLKLMAMDRVIKEIDAREEAAKLEVGSTGYTSQKSCEEYELRWQHNNIPFEPYSQQTLSDGSTINIDDNPVPGPANGGTPTKYANAVALGDGMWVCLKQYIATPANLISDTTSKTAGLDYDYILQSEDLSAYISAISDAFINRLTTEANKGLSNMFKGGGSPSRGSATSRDNLYITPGIQDATNNYDSNINETYTYDPATITASKTSLYTALAGATSSLIYARGVLSTNLPTNTSQSNALLVCTLNGGAACGGTRGLIQCIAGSIAYYPMPYVSVAPIGPVVSNTLTLAQQRQTTIATAVTQTNLLINQANTLLTRIQNANTSTDINTVMNDIKAYADSAKNLATQADSLLSEVTTLLTEARRQRDECNLDYP